MRPSNPKRQLVAQGGEAGLQSSEASCVSLNTNNLHSHTSREQFAVDKESTVQLYLQTLLDGFDYCQEPEIVQLRDISPTLIRNEKRSPGKQKLSKTRLNKENAAPPEEASAIQITSKFHFGDADTNTNSNDVIPYGASKREHGDDPLAWFHMRHKVTLEEEFEEFKKRFLWNGSRMTTSSHNLSKLNDADHTSDSRGTIVVSSTETPKNGKTKTAKKRGSESKYFTSTDKPSNGHETTISHASAKRVDGLGGDLVSSTVSPRDDMTHFGQSDSNKLSNQSGTNDSKLSKQSYADEKLVKLAFGNQRQPPERTTQEISIQTDEVIVVLSRDDLNSLRYAMNNVLPLLNDGRSSSSQVPKTHTATPQNRETPAAHSDSKSNPKFGRLSPLSERIEHYSLPSPSGTQAVEQPAREASFHTGPLDTDRLRILKAKVKDTRPGTFGTAETSISAAKISPSVEEQVETIKLLAKEKRRQKERNRRLNNKHSTTMNRRQSWYEWDEKRQMRRAGELPPLSRGASTDQRCESEVAPARRSNKDYTEVESRKCISEVYPGHLNTLNMNFDAYIKAMEKMVDATLRSLIRTDSLL